MLLAWMAQAVLAAGPDRTSAPASSPADPWAGNACVQCHRDLPGRSSRIVDLEWKHSVHYAANVGCDGCHGGDPSVRRERFASDEAFKKASHVERNPEFLLLHQDNEFVSEARGRSVSYFCGKCHVKIKENHLGSPHGDFGAPTCLYCHGQGSHKILHPGPEIVDTRGRNEGGRCTPCHRAETMKSVARIKALLLDAEEQIKVSGDLYSAAQGWGYRNLELEKMHSHAAEVRSQLRQIFHSFNMREINNYAGEIQGVVDRTRATFDMVERLRRKQRLHTAVGAGAVLLLLTFAGLLVYYKKAFLDHHRPTSR
jgi:hypothetical protein